MDSITSADTALKDSYSDAETKTKAMTDAHNAFDHSSLDGNVREMATLQAAFNTANTDFGAKNMAYGTSPSGQTLAELQMPFQALAGTSYYLIEKADEVIIASGQYDTEITPKLRQARAAVTAYDSAETALQAVVDSAPGAPTGLAATADNAKVKLEWDAPSSVGTSEITDYVIRYSIGAGNTWLSGDGTAWIPFADGIGTGTTATVTGLTNGQAYSFSVSAKSSVGEGPASVTSATPAATVPGAPTGLAATAGNTEVELSWDAPGDDGGEAVTGYKVEYIADGGSRWTVFETDTGTTDTEITVTGLTNGQAYSFRVYAINSVGTGTIASDSVTETPALPAVSPVPVPGRTVSAPDGGTPDTITDTASPVITLIGDNPLYLAQYNTFRDPGATATDDVDGTVIVNSSGHVNTKSVGTYTLTYTATDNAGNTDTAERTVNVYSRPSVPPTVITAVPGDSQVTLTWENAQDGNSPITGYDISYRVKGSSDWSTVTTGTVLTHVIEGLTNGDTYQFKVSAKTQHHPTGNQESSPVEATPAGPSAPVIPSGSAGPSESEVPAERIADYYHGPDHGIPPTVEYDKDGRKEPRHPGTDPIDKVPITFDSVSGATGPDDNGDYVATSGEIVIRGSVAANFVQEIGDVNLYRYTGTGDATEAVGNAVNVSEYEFEFTKSLGDSASWGFGDHRYLMYAVYVGESDNTPYPGAYKFFTITKINPDSVPSADTPSAPVGLVAVPGSGQVVLSWEEPDDDGGSDILLYDVGYAPVGGSAYKTEEFPGTARGATIDGLENGKNYAFHVHAKNAAGFGPATEDVEAVPSAAMTPVPAAECNPATDANHCCTAIGQEITVGGDDQVYHVCTAEDLPSETVEGGSERVPVTHDESHPTCSISLRDPPTTIPGTGYGRVSGTATQVIGNVGTSALTGIMISVSDWTYEDGETAPGMHREIRTHGSAEWTEVRPGMPAHVTDGLPLPGSGDGLAVEYRVDMTGNTDGAGKGPISQTITYAASCS